RGGRLRGGRRLHQPDEGARTGTHLQPLRQPGAGATTNCEADLRQRGAQTISAARGYSREVGETLDENALGTALLPTEEPSCPDLQRDGTAVSQQVRQDALVTAVDVPRTTLAAGARCPAAGGRHRDGEGLVVRDSVHEAVPLRQEEWKRCGHCDLRNGRHRLPAFDRSLA